MGVAIVLGGFAASNILCWYVVTGVEVGHYSNVDRAYCDRTGCSDGRSTRNVLHRPPIPKVATSFSFSKLLCLLSAGNLLNIYDCLASSEVSHESFEIWIFIIIRSCRWRNCKPLYDYRQACIISSGRITGGLRGPGPHERAGGPLETCDLRGYKGASKRPPWNHLPD